MKKKQHITGYFRTHKLGFGFVKPIKKSHINEVFIPKKHTNLAVEGDLVRVNILKKDVKGYDGEIVEVIERKLKQVGGTVTEVHGRKVYVHCPLLGSNKEVEVVLRKDQNLQLGDRIYLSLHSKKSQKGLKGTFKELIGSIDDATIDSQAAVAEFAIRNEFSDAIRDQLKTLPSEIIPANYPEREDLQKLVTFTIDPDTAKDYDDAISLEKTKNNHWQLGVHIADVSFFVKEGTALDEEAYLRCNSTYLPDRCISMLPKELADNLCSLKPRVPRLAVSTFMTINANGEVMNYRIVRSIIKSAERFTYEQVKDILDKKKKHPLEDKIKDLEELALLLKNVRKKRGCIELALDESKLILDKNGIPKLVKKISYDITHQMIEEFMLKNNEVIAKHLSEKEIPIPFRIHENPKPENIEGFVQIAGALGAKLPQKPTLQDLQKLFASIQGTTLEHHLSVHFIKCMKLAYYSPENLGHFGLQLDYYSHFTSPIRRYVDLVIHRQLFNPSKNPPIQEISDRCSEKERLSAKAESAVKDLKMLRFFKNQPKGKNYVGIITKVKPFGLFFEIPELLYEGYVHVSDLGRDYYLFDEKNCRFKTERSKTSLQVGKKIKVKVKSLDLVKNEIEWVR